MMDIRKYTSYFHDGDLFAILHDDESLDLSMESAQMDEEDLEDPIPLSNNSGFPTLRGKLCIRGIRKIILNDMLFTGRLEKTHDGLNIFDLEITDHSVELQLILERFCSPREEGFWVIKIDADTIYWDNIPDLPDP